LIRDATVSCGLNPPSKDTVREEPVMEIPETEEISASAELSRYTSSRLPRQALAMSEMVIDLK
jgi:hypothetical protein